MGSAAAIILTDLALTSINYLIRRGFNMIELQQRHDQRVAAGLDGLTKEDLKEFKAKAQASINSIRGTGE